MVVVQCSASITAVPLIFPRAVSFASVVLHTRGFRLLGLLVSNDFSAFWPFTPKNVFTSCRQQPHHLEIHSRKQSMETPPLHEPVLCRHYHRETILYLVLNGVPHRMQCPTLCIVGRHLVCARQCSEADNLKPFFDELGVVRSLW